MPHGRRSAVRAGAATSTRGTPRRNSGRATRAARPRRFRRSKHRLGPRMSPGNNRKSPGNSHRSPSSNRKIHGSTRRNPGTSHRGPGSSRKSPGTSHRSPGNSPRKSPPGNSHTSPGSSRKSLGPTHRNPSSNRRSPSSNRRSPGSSPATTALHRRRTIRGKRRRSAPALRSTACPRAIRRSPHPASSHWAAGPRTRPRRTSSRRASRRTGRSFRHRRPGNQPTSSPLRPGTRSMPSRRTAGARPARPSAADLRSGRSTADGRPPATLASMPPCRPWLRTCGRTRLRPIGPHRWARARPETRRLSAASLARPHPPVRTRPGLPRHRPAANRPCNRPKADIPPRLRPLRTSRRGRADTPRRRPAHSPHRSRPSTRRRRLPTGARPTTRRDRRLRHRPACHPLHRQQGRPAAEPRP